MTDVALDAPSEPVRRAVERPRPIPLAVLAAAVLAIPQIVPGVYMNVVSRAAVYGIMALSMNVLVGYAGQASLGHAAFLGLGAFGSGYALTEMGMPFGAALVVAALTGMAAAVVLGGVALRVTGLYLALVTSTFLIPAFTGVVLGGITSMKGAVIGGFALGIVSQAAIEIVSELELDVPGPPQLAVLLVLLAVLLVRPQGLLGGAR